MKMGAWVDWVVLSARLYMYVPVRLRQAERHTDNRKGQGELPAFRWGNNGATSRQARQGKVKEEGWENRRESTV